jgi:hypothetical protein
VEPAENRPGPLVRTSVMKPSDVAPDVELPDQFGVPRRLTTMLQQGPVALFF